jgi:asparagine synthase (glutamine-hydrolysing)
LDSSTLAAKAVMAVADTSRVIAETRYFDHLIPDDERRFSSLVASRLGIRHTLRSVDDTFYDRLWYTREIHTPEPTFSVTNAAPERLFGAEMAKEALVWFYGEGPDNALTFEWRTYLRWLWMQRDWRRFGDAVVWCLGSKQARGWHAVIGRYASLWRKDERGSSDTPRQWLDDAFVKKLDLAARAHEAPNADASLHPWHPRALASFTSPIWPHFLEGFDAAVSGAPIEWRHPYLDLRVLTFLLSVPPIPWARRKLLIREAMKDALPREVLSRDKAPLIEDPIMKMVQKYPLSGVSLCKEMQEFVNEHKVPARPRDASQILDLIHVFVLDHWLKNRG